MFNCPKYECCSFGCHRRGAVYLFEFECRNVFLSAVRVEVLFRFCFHFISFRFVVRRAILLFCKLNECYTQRHFYPRWSSCTLKWCEQQSCTIFHQHIAKMKSNKRRSTLSGSSALSPFCASPFQFDGWNGISNSSNIQEMWTYEKSNATNSSHAHSHT